MNGEKNIIPGFDARDAMTKIETNVFIQVSHRAINGCSRKENSYGTATHFVSGRDQPDFIADGFSLGVGDVQQRRGNHVRCQHALQRCF